jgi:DnaJ-class molecular chaperone
MRSKTYYMILGVSRAESPSGIRAAYRDLVKRLHPDVAGEQSTRAFQEVIEAYDVLSDPQRRRDYNNKLRQTENGEVAEAHHGKQVPMVRSPMSIVRGREDMRPSFEAIHDRFLRNFTGIAVPKSEHLEGLNFEVLLTAQESLLGCVVSVGVPVFERCPRCGGSRRDWVFPCTYCRQQGMIEDEDVVRIRIPPRAPSGSIFELPLRGLGIHNFYLRLHVFVEACH